jgi:hypothetical protein
MSTQEDRQSVIITRATAVRIWNEGKNNLGMDADAAAEVRAAINKPREATHEDVAIELKSEIAKRWAEHLQYPGLPMDSRLAFEIRGPFAFALIGADESENRFGRKAG